MIDEKNFQQHFKYNSYLIRTHILICRIIVALSISGYCLFPGLALGLIVLLLLNSTALTLLIILLACFLSAWLGFRNYQKVDLLLKNAEPDMEQKFVSQYKMRLVQNSTEYSQLFEMINTICNQLDITLPDVYVIDNTNFKNLTAFVNDQDVPYLIITQSLLDNCDSSTLNDLMMSQLLLMKLGYTNLIIEQQIISNIIKQCTFGYVLFIAFAGFLLFKSMALAILFLLVGFSILGWLRFNYYSYAKNAKLQIRCIYRIVSDITGDNDAVLNAFNYLYQNNQNIQIDNEVQLALGSLWLRPIKDCLSVLPSTSRLDMIDHLINVEDSTTSLKNAFSFKKWW